MIGVADRATGAREKHRAAPKALAIGLDACGDRASGLWAFDHDHTHVSPLDLVFEAKKPAGWIAPLVGAVTCFDRACGRSLVAGACSNLPGRPLERTPAVN